jgi:hypothetical protein
MEQEKNRDHRHKRNILQESERHNHDAIAVSDQCDGDVPVLWRDKRFLHMGTLVSFKLSVI